MKIQIIKNLKFKHIADDKYILDSLPEHTEDISHTLFLGPIMIDWTQKKVVGVKQ